MKNLNPGDLVDIEATNGNGKEKKVMRKIKEVVNEILEWLEIIALAGILFYCLMHIFVI